MAGGVRVISARRTTPAFVVEGEEAHSGVVSFLEVGVVFASMQVVLE